jgi:hypothetical protein
VNHPEDGFFRDQLAHGAILRADEFDRAAASQLATADKEAETGNIVVSQFVTLDGVFEDPGGAEGFERGGWAVRFDRGDDGDKFKLDEVIASDALLLGRITVLSSPPYSHSVGIESRSRSGRGSKPLGEKGRR